MQGDGKRVMTEKGKLAEWRGADADKIRDAYGCRGLHFLRPAWEKFQKKDLR